MFVNTGLYYQGNHIEKETMSAILFKIPKTKWMFWISKKCVRVNGSNVSLGLNTEWEYTIFKMGNGKWNNFTKIAEEKINGTELLKMFGIEI